MRFKITSASLKVVEDMFGVVHYRLMAEVV